MSDRWYDYFSKHGASEKSWLEAAVRHWGFHQILYGVIQRYCPPPARIFDVGSGPGWSDLYLSSSGYNVSGIDNEPRLAELASDLATRLGVAASFEVADAFDLSPYYGHFDLAYSCGVLEHFDREITIQLLREQAKCARRVLIQIPTRYAAYTGEITDERFYTINELRRIVQDAGLQVEAAFGYGDVTATSAQNWLRRLLPRAIYRYLQNRGYAYGIAVLGVSSGSTGNQL